MTHPYLELPLARALVNDRLATAARERLATEARKAQPGFKLENRWRDTAFWASILGPLFGLGFLAYFAQELVRASVQ